MMHDSEYHHHDHDEQRQGHRPLHQDGLTGDMERLKKLIDHWINHNKSHGQSYFEWTAKAQESNRPDIAEELRTVTELLEKADQCLERIRKSL